MSGRGVVQVSPDDLLAAAEALRPSRQRSDVGAARNVRAIAEEMSTAEVVIACSDFNRRLMAAIDALDGRRAELRRGLESAASAYATSDALVAREMQPGT